MFDTDNHGVSAQHEPLIPFCWVSLEMKEFKKKKLEEQTICSAGEPRIKENRLRQKSLF